MFKMLIGFIFLSINLFATVKIVTTLSDYADITKQIGGNKVDVQYLCEPTQDPHFVDAKPSFIVKLNKADLLIVTGLGLEEGWIPSLITNSSNGKITEGSNGYLDLSKHVTLKEVNVSSDKSAGDVHAGGNPHFYNSPEETLKIATAIYEKLIDIDSNNFDYYDANYKAFETKYNEKLKEWNLKLEKIKNIQIVEYHKSFIYFNEWAKLESVGAIEPKPGIPPSAGHIAKLLSSLKSKDVKFVFQEIYNKNSLTESFAKKAKAKIITIPTMVGAEKGINNIFDKFDKIVDMLCE